MLLRAAPAAAAALLPATARRASLCGRRRASLCDSMHTSTSAPAATEKRVLKGLVFDMDGTVIVPCIDFAGMRRACGVLEGQDILDVISKRSKEEQDKAYAAIAEVEDQALRDMTLMPDALELLKFLDGLGIPRGLITRNVLRSVHHFHANHLVPQGVSPFLPAISRECPHPYKPHPQALLHICSSWGVAPHEVIMVGDSAKDDIVSGNRAGALTVLLDYEGRDGFAANPPTGEQAPTHVVHSLGELKHLLQKQYLLVPPPRPHPAVEAA